jgi:scyllo-inositol 2-dehydrogenase (NADP+)
MKDKLNVALVGFGVAGEIFHSPFIIHNTSLHLSTVVERHHQKSKEKFPWVKVVKDYREAIADREIDAVIITTPNELHYPVAKEAILAGVFIGFPRFLGALQVLPFLVLYHMSMPPIPPFILDEK